MSFLEIYALFLAPLLVGAIGVAAAWLHIRDAKKHDHTHHPAE